MRRADPERLHQARRAAHVNRLTSAGWPQAAAAAALVAWGAAQDDAGRDRQARDYWTGIDAWAADRRRQFG